MLLLKNTTDLGCLAGSVSGYTTRSPGFESHIECRAYLKTKTNPENK